jgi:replicative DNA helicase
MAPMANDVIALFDDHAESAVIGMLLFGEQTLDDVPELRREWFYANTSQRIFDAIADLHRGGTPVCEVNVASKLREAGRMADIGGHAKLTELMDGVPHVSAKRLKSYVATLRNAHALRVLRAVARKMLAGVEQPNALASDIGSEATEKLHEALSLSSTETAANMRDLLHAVVVELKEKAARGEKLSGTQTGFSALDKLMGGLHPGDSLVIAARPGMGKSAFALCIALNVVRQGHGAVMFSLEMPSKQLAMRALCADAGVDLAKSRAGLFSPTDWTKMTAAVQTGIASRHFIIDDKSSVSLGELRAKAQRAQRDMARAGVSLRVIVVDYLQLIGHKADNREQAIAETSRFLKELAKDLSVTVLALSQLNRGVEQRTDKRPMLSDLRESGSIEQDADACLLLYREDYYNQQPQYPGMVEVIIAKHRNGPTGTVLLGFEKTSTAFHEREVYAHAP